MKSKKIIVLGIVVTGTIFGIVFGLDMQAQPDILPPENFKIAIIGDQGLGPNSIAVLQLIKDENADLVVHSGDLDYQNNPEAWDDQITKILGENFPYFVSAGGHDMPIWEKYQEQINSRLNKLDGVYCSGDIGIKSSCSYKGVFFILIETALTEASHVEYIKDELSNNENIWRFCSFHWPHNELQVGAKYCEVCEDSGWKNFEECRKGGAIILNGHEHSYHRTKTLSSIENQTVDPQWSRPNQMKVSEGSSFVVVSGLGGVGIREQGRCLPNEYPYGCNNEWANIYTASQGANFGALFCTLHVNGDPKQAQCYFKDISGNIPDEFSITNFVNTK